MPNKKAQIDEVALRRLYEAGVSMPECARRFGVGIATIHRRLKTLGVASRPAGPCVKAGSPIAEGVPRAKDDKAAYMRAYRQKNRERILAQNRAYKASNKNRLAPIDRERAKRWYEANKERYAAQMKAAYLSDREARIAASAESRRRRRDADPDAFKAKEAAYMRRRRRSDVRHALDDRMSNMIWRALKRDKGGRSWKTMVPYTVEQLRAHLEKTMPEGYGWSDFLNGDLHIDHKIPRSAFNYRAPEDYDFKRCWALNNLQLLPAADNLSKGDRLERPFQPSLV